MKSARSVPQHRLVCGAPGPGLKLRFDFTNAPDPIERLVLTATSANEPPVTETIVVDSLARGLIVTRDILDPQRGYAIDVSTISATGVPTGPAEKPQRIGPVRPVSPPRTRCTRPSMARQTGAVAEFDARAPNPTLPSGERRRLAVRRRANRIAANLAARRDSRPTRAFAQDGSPPTAAGSRTVSIGSASGEHIAAACDSR